jgi:hypothetical protein
VYPAGWRVGDVSNDFLQLFNYPDKGPLYSGSVFGKGENKIEMYITDNNFFNNLNDLDSHITKSTIVNQNQTIIKWVNGNVSNGYLIPLENNANKFLGITIYGDQNSSVFDQIISNFRWTKK